MGTRYEAKYLVDYVEEIMNNPKMISKLVYEKKIYKYHKIKKLL